MPNTQFVPARIDLGRAIAQVVNLTRARWLDMPQERGVVIRVEISVAPELPAVLGSDSEIRDALTNLVLNAADAMPEGGTLTLRAYPTFDDRDATTGPGARLPSQVRLEVSDTGIGMDEQTRRRCVEPFFTTKGERGTGLGLAMVYGTVQRQGGEIEVASRPREGTTVSLIFPVARNAANAGVIQEAESAGAGRNSTTTRDEPTEVDRPPRSLRILVVEDDPVLLRSLRDTLEAEGHRVAVAHGGQTGIDAFIDAQRQGEPFDLVLTDLGMPYVDGRRVASAVKSASPNTPVVLVTGWGRQMQAEKEVPPHVDRLLGKPPSLGELREAVTSLTAC